MSDLSQSGDSRCDQYRDLLETWAEWWNNIGRYHFTHYITPPLNRTAEALGCTICSGIHEPGERCQACGRKLDD
jgi:hypothetical protein